MDVMNDVRAARGEDLSAGSSRSEGAVPKAAPDRRRRNVSTTGKKWVERAERAVLMEYHPLVAFMNGQR
jgi:hypothetical protein